MSLESNVNSVLLENKRKRDAVAAATAPTPVVETPVTAPVQPGGVQTTTIQPPVTSQPAPVTESSKEKAVPEVSTTPPPVPAKETKPEPPAPVTTEEVEFKWDADIPDTTTTEEKPSVVDLKKLSSALELQVDTEEEFISQVKEKLTQPDIFEGVDERLKKAVEIAKKGGDWLAYTGAAALDASKLDPVKLFEREYTRANAHRFLNPDGEIDLEKMDQALDNLDPGLKEMEGKRLKNELVQRQQYEQAQIVARAVAQQEQFQKGLGEAAKELPNLLPKDKFGVVIEPKHASFVYDGIVKGTLIKKHFGNLDSAVLAKMDPRKLMKTVAMAELGEKISELRYKQGEVFGKKALLQSTQNINIQSPSYVPQPNEETVEKPTTADMLRAQQEKMRPKGSL